MGLGWDNGCDELRRGPIKDFPAGRPGQFLGRILTEELEGATYQPCTMPCQVETAGKRHGIVPLA